jgi:tetratricopeptide (TPR) repeat protein
MRKICIAAALLVPALAWGQPRTAEDWYKEGETQFNLGNFDKAIVAFKEGFSLETSDSKKAAYLYNVAQSYRQANDCKNALFFYKRFLALKANDTAKPLAPKVRKDVEDRITELESCVQQAASISKKPPNNNIPPGGDGTDRPSTPEDSHAPPGTTVATATPEPDPDTVAVRKTTPPSAPHVLSLRATGGGTKLSTGDIDVPVQFTAALVAGYPIRLNDQLTLEPGVAFTFSPVPYDGGSAQIYGLMANGGLSYEVLPRAAIRLDVGLGAMFFAGASESPFTAGAQTSGALSMFHARAALSGDYAFTPSFFGTITPIAFTYSPAKAGLDESIDAITSIDFMLGIGYRM